MLANNFKTPAALGISDVEFDALVKVLGMLERREIPEENFTMRDLQDHCRTPSCICGWANHVSQGRAFPLQSYSSTMIPGRAVIRPRWEDMPRRLLELFAYRRRPADPIYSATRSQAAVALRNYLTYGEARWGEALAG